ncbi:MAG: condensation domain-containing protein, partial [Candidatus Binatia bacterium]
MASLTEQCEIAAHGSTRKADPYERSNLTKNQLQVWIGQALVPEAPVYHLAGILNITGEIDPTHFQKAFQTLINSSDALRTVLEETDGVPRQKVIQPFPYSVEYLDFSSLPDPRSEAKTWAHKSCQSPFNLQQRLFDSVLIKTSAKE